MKKFLTVMTFLLFFCSVSSSATNFLNVQSNNETTNLIKKDKPKYVIDNLDNKVQNIAFNSINNSYYVAGQYLYKSTDGIIFNKINTNLPSNSVITSLTITFSGLIFLVINNKDLYVSIKDTVDNQFVKLDTSISKVSTNVISKVYAFYEKLYLIINNILYGTEINSFSSSTTLYLSQYNNFEISDYVAYPQEGLDFYLTNNLLGKTLVNDDNKVINSWGNSNNKINNLVTDNNDNLYISSGNNIFCSEDNGKTFSLFFTSNAGEITNFFFNNGVMYYFVNKNGISQLMMSNPFSFLVLNNMTKNKFNPVNNTFTFDAEYKGDIDFFKVSSQFASSAQFNGKNIVLNKNIYLQAIGNNVLNITLKDQYKQYATFFNGNETTGQVTYNINYEVPINQNSIVYNSKDNNLASMLISNSGNTLNQYVIASSGANDIISVDLTNNNFDLQKSYYVQGDVDSNNNFNANGNKIYLNKANFNNNKLTISGVGIYQLYFYDNQKNCTYISYLEIGQSQLKIKGALDTSQQSIINLAKELNVNLSLSNASAKNLKQIGDKLNKLKSTADIFFNIFLKQNYPDLVSKETLDTIPGSYKILLDDINYEQLHREPFNGTFNTIIYNDFNVLKFKSAFLSIYYSDIRAKISSLKFYNIDTSSITNYKLLNQFILWANNFNKFINTNLFLLIKKTLSQVLKGYTSDSFKNTIFLAIKKNILILSFNYNLNKIYNLILKSKLVWNSNMTKDYLSLIDFSKVNNELIIFLNKKFPGVIDKVNKDFQEDLKIQESNLNLHGYTIAQVLGIHQTPQTKSQMENYGNSGKSFHSWLQTEANHKFHKWEISIALGVSIPLFLIFIIFIVLYSANYYRVYSACGMRKRLKPRKVQK